jgi:hypothetical protein
MRIKVGDLRRLVRESMDEFMSWKDLPRIEQIKSEYSDVYKEKFGIRPRWKLAELEQMSLEDAEAALQELLNTPDDEF